MRDERWLIPNSWQWIYAEEIANVTGGGTPSTRDSSNFTLSGDGIPWLTPADLSKYDATYIERGSRDISEKGLISSSAKLMPQGTVLFTSRAPIGYCVIAANEISTNQGFKSLSLYQNISPELIRFYLLISKRYVESFASGSTFKELSGKKVAQLKIPLPPLNEQKRIVTKIEALQTRSTAAKQELKAIKPLLNQFRQSVLAAAFRGDLTKDWRKQNPDIESAEVLLERIRVERRRRWEEAELEKMKVKGKVPKDDKWKKKCQEPEPIDNEALPELPDSWLWVKADQICSQITDGEHNQSPYQPEGFPMLTAKHVQDGYIDMTTAKLISKEAFSKARLRCAPMNGDLLIVSVGATTGRAGIVIDCPAFAIVRSVLLLKTLSNVRFVLNWIRTIWCQKWISKASGASAQAHLYINDTKIMPIPFPSEQEQKEIVRRIESLFKLADNIEQQYQQAEADLKTFNQSILAKAFRGELVPQNPNDEPASVLLERIRAERDKAKPKKSKTEKKRSSKKEDKQLGIPGI